MAKKIFEVGDVLPIGWIRVSWDITSNFYDCGYVRTLASAYSFINTSDISDTLIADIPVYDYRGTWYPPYTGSNGNHNYIDIDVSDWSASKRTVSSNTITSTYKSKVFWEAISAPPATTAERLLLVAENDNAINNIKQDIKTSITNKGVSMTDVPFTEYANKIDTIQTQKEEQAKSATPTKATQVITPDSGKALSQVTVNPIPSNFIDPTDGTAVVGEVLASKTFYAGNSTKKTGTMINRGAVNTDITTKAQEVTIGSGYHSGAGKVKISSTEQAKIIASNIKAGVTILGQAGEVNPLEQVANMEALEALTPTEGRIVEVLEGEPTPEPTFDFFGKLTIVFFDEGGYTDANLLKYSFDSGTTQNSIVVDLPSDGRATFQTDLPSTFYPYRLRIINSDGDDDCRWSLTTVWTGYNASDAPRIDAQSLSSSGSAIPSGFDQYFYDDNVKFSVMVYYGHVEHN